jgi:dihydrofolate reductase
MLPGRKTYEFALAHSPRPQAKSKKAEGRRSAETGMRSYVFSRTIKQTPDDGAIIVSENGGEFVRNLKTQAGKDIWLMGGGSPARNLFAENLVDEINLNIHPILLGSGIPCFPKSADNST